MSLPRTIRSATLVQQNLISGVLVDALTNEAPLGAPGIELLDRDTDREHPLPGRLLSDGSFSFYGAPETAFPEIDGRTYRLRIEVVAGGYESAQFDFEIGPLPGQPQLVTRSIPFPEIADIRIPLFQVGLPRTDISIMLQPLAVRLSGRVVVSDAPAEAVPNCTLELNPPSGITTITDAAGEYTFVDPLPVSPSVVLELSATGFESRQMTHELDYSQPVNQVQLGLKRT